MFWTKYAPKGDFRSQTTKTKQTKTTIEFPICIRLSTEFQIKLAILIFGEDLPKQGISGQKRKNVNITIEFYIFELVSLPNMSLNWQFWFR